MGTHKARMLTCYVVATWSGFFVMLVELLSGRMLAPYFGSSIYIWGSVIFTFMLGLAVGYLRGGIYSARRAGLAPLCLMLVIAAAATLPAAIFGDALMGWAFDTLPDPRAGSLFASLALFFLPAAASGMISPYAVRVIVQDTASSGRSAGYLYFFSTLGSSLGTLATSFFLVLWFEVNLILAGAMAISLLVAAATALIARVPEA